MLDECFFQMRIAQFLYFLMGYVTPSVRALFIGGCFQLDDGDRSRATSVRALWLEGSYIINFTHHSLLRLSESDISVVLR